MRNIKLNDRILVLSSKNGSVKTSIDILALNNISFDHTMQIYLEGDCLDNCYDCEFGVTIFWTEHTYRSFFNPKLTNQWNNMPSFYPSLIPPFGYCSPPPQSILSTYQRSSSKGKLFSWAMRRRWAPNYSSP